MAEKLLSGFFLLISCLYTYYATELSFGRFTQPKAGFLPTLAGSIATLLSLFLVIRSFSEQSANKTATINQRKLAFIAIGLLAYIILLQLVGYLVASIIILFYLLKMAEVQGWLFPCLLSVGIATSFYFIFEKLLGAKLP